MTSTFLTILKRPHKIGKFDNTAGRYYFQYTYPLWRLIILSVSKERNFILLKSQKRWPDRPKRKVFRIWNFNDRIYWEFCSLVNLITYYICLWKEMFGAYIKLGLLWGYSLHKEILNCFKELFVYVNMIWITTCHYYRCYYLSK